MTAMRAAVGEAINRSGGDGVVNNDLGVTGVAADAAEPGGGSGGDGVGGGG